MDRNTVIGFLLIAAIVLGFSWLNKPSAEEMERRKRYNDSIAWVQQQEAQQQIELDSARQMLAESQNGTLVENDSAMRSDAFGGFGAAAAGEEEFVTLENELVKLVFSTRGGRVYSAELKNYKAQEGKPLVLFDAEESGLNYVLATNTNRVVNTSELFFEPQGGVTTDDEGNQNLTLRLKTDVKDSYIDFIYSLKANDYMLKYDMKANNMNEVMPMSINSIDLQWHSLIRQQEKGRVFEERYSTLSFKYLADDVNNLKANKNDKKEVANQIKWVAFKDQFFSSVMIADNAFQSGLLVSNPMNEKTGYMKAYEAELVVPFDLTGQRPTGFTFYFGPNHYATLSAYDKHLEKDEKLKLRELVPLGWSLARWVNQILIIPMFNFFGKYINSLGVIILLMTLAIRLLLAPLSHKSYMSSAKMRVLKPQIDEINARIPAEKAMERQKATMDLYNKMGVSPMSGCLPMIIQFPVLIALFFFFPTAIELRQESFLWAKDLSSYDAILTWNANIPIISNIFKNHISLFALLMMVTTIFSTRISMANTQPAADQPGAGMMKNMMYVMPIMFFFLFNSYASGLTYYYTLSSLFTVIQNNLTRVLIDDKKLLADLEKKSKEKAKKGKKGGGMMARLERMQREQEKMMRENAKKKKR